MVVSDAIHNIMGGMESTAGVRLHNHRRKLKQRFDIIKKLGQGTYGKVQLGINKETGQEVAIKTIKKSKIETDADLVRIRREIQIMSSVQHPNIIHIYEVFENREKMVLVMEYAAGGELYDYLSERKVLDETEARRIFRQISTAVYYCHKHKICHRDLKLENILLDEHGSAKIADFGLSNVFDEQRLLGTFCGSPLYASPEIVKGTPYHGPEVDCWSLGVLLYTLVYGAMPFDGSNFKRLVKQISQGDYFEPKKPSPASSLIRDMLNVNPACRADIEKICAHRWVNESQSQSCVEIAEELANQTPVRLDLLLSLAPPPLLAAKDQEAASTSASAGPTRSQSVGSLMDLDHNPRSFDPERRRLSEAGRVPVVTAIGKEAVPPPKRKLEQGPSTEDAAQGGGAKRKERREREHSTERRRHRSSSRSKHKPDSKGEPAPAEQPKEVAPEPMDVDAEASTALREAEPTEKAVETSEKPVETEKAVEIEEKVVETSEKPVVVTEVAETTEKKAEATEKVVETAKEVKEEIPKPEAIATEETPPADEAKKVKVKRKKKPDAEPKIPDPKEEVVTPKTETEPKDSSHKEEAASKEVATEETPQAVKTDTTPTEVKEKKVVKKVVKKKSDSKVAGDGLPPPPEEPAAPPTKPMVRRRSKIFESEIEKFNKLATVDAAKVPDKPKKVFIPGVKVSDFKRAYERKSSVDLSPASKVEPAPENGDKPAETSDKPAETSDKPEETTTKPEEPATEVVPPTVESETEKVTTKKEPVVAAKKEPEPVEPVKDETIAKKQKAAAIIGNAIARPPKPTLDKLGSRNTTAGVASPPDSPKKKSAGVKLPTVGGAKTEEVGATKTVDGEGERAKKSSKVEIVLKSATLPRRKTSKAEIQLGAPKVEYRTEVEHMVGAAPTTVPGRLQNQRSEVAFPVAAASPAPQPHRSMSVEPEGATKQKPKERIIPIQFERPVQDRPSVSSPPPRPPVPPLSQQRSMSQRSSSLSRQSTLDSDTEGTVSGEPIRKSPREYIIPIAVEGGGYVTPRSGSLEPDSSAAPTEPTAHKPRKSVHRFPRAARMGSLLSDGGLSEDEGFNSISSPFGTLNRHAEPEDGFHHMHRLRSSRPTRRAAPERSDSLSSAEEDDEEDDAFELLTAESLFSTLLSRVRNLTQRLNVDDNRTGFPSGRFMNHNFPSHSSFWGNMEPVSRRVSETSRPSRDESSGSSGWRRSASRDNTDCDSQYSDAPSSSLPRGSSRHDFDDTCEPPGHSPYPSYYTPSLARRIQRTSQELRNDYPAPAIRRPMSRTTSLRSEDGTGRPPIRSLDSSRNARCFERSGSVDRFAQKVADGGRSRGNREDGFDAARMSGRPVDKGSSDSLDYGSERSKRATDSSLGSKGTLGSSDSLDYRNERNKKATEGSKGTLGSSDSLDYAHERSKRAINRSKGVLGSSDSLDYRSERNKRATDSSLGSKGTLGSSDSLDYRSERSKSYLPPTLRALDTLPRRQQAYRSSMSDMAEYARKRPEDAYRHSQVSEEGRALPPLPQATTYGRRRDPGLHKSSSYLRQRAIDIAHVYGAPLPVAGPTRLERDSTSRLVRSGSTDRSSFDERMALKYGEVGEERGRSQIPRASPHPRSLSSVRGEEDPAFSIVRRQKSFDRLDRPQRPSSLVLPVDNSVLGKFLNGDSDATEGDGSTSPARSPGRKVSRFLRPDFYSTPREESAFAREKDDASSKSPSKEVEGKEIKSQRYYKQGSAEERQNEAKQTDVDNPKSLETRSQQVDSGLFKNTNGHTEQISGINIAKLNGNVENTKAPESSVPMEPKIAKVFKPKVLTTSKKEPIPTSSPKPVLTSPKPVLTSPKPIDIELPDAIVVSDVKPKPVPRDADIAKPKAVEETVSPPSPAVPIELTSKIPLQTDSKAVRAAKLVSNGPNVKSPAQQVTAKFTEGAAKVKTLKKKVKKPDPATKAVEVKGADETKPQEVTPEVKGVKSRVERAIRSLRERSLTPKGSEDMASVTNLLKRAVSVDNCASDRLTTDNKVMRAIRTLKELVSAPRPDADTETNLLKRAVSVDDCSTSGPGSRPNGVNSVLGIFRRMEEPKDKKASLLARFRKTQSLYAGSASDSVLVPGREGKAVVPSKGRKFGFGGSKKVPGNVDAPDPNVSCSVKIRLPDKPASKPVVNKTSVSTTLTVVKVAETNGFADVPRTTAVDKPPDHPEESGDPEGVDDSCSVCSADWGSRGGSPTNLPYQRRPAADTEGSETMQERIRRKSFFSRFNDDAKRRPRASTNHTAEDL